MQVTKLTTKNQATVPSEVRKHLGVGAGDTIEYDILDNGDVLVRKAVLLPFDAAYHAALQETLSEWQSPEDDVYNDL
ncbi:AbrB/MazE/SpoVT family DNA-binding domain-containing protein [Piscirickettsia salmonis]|uniref:AbrB/MazE/SpoVT family DNA-binding domain-containing protein n=1 Tax=Piscirickettsia salmonis TaxID=1238 RepID=UPI0007C94F02|nr:putative regulator PrlF [Piscirickettsiaceae bacterium NZ-RLO1]